MAGPSVRMGDAADRLVVDELAALVAGSDLDGSLMGSSVFFLPSPNNPRTLLFFGGWLAEYSGFRSGHAAVARTFSPFWSDAGSNGSAKAGTGWADGPLCSGAVLARLILRFEFGDTELGAVALCLAGKTNVVDGGSLRMPRARVGWISYCLVLAELLCSFADLEPVGPDRFHVNACCVMRSDFVRSR